MTESGLRVTSPLKGERTQSENYMDQSKKKQDLTNKVNKKIKTTTSLEQIEHAGAEPEKKENEEEENERKVILELLSQPKK